MLYLGHYQKPREADTMLHPSPWYKLSYPWTRWPIQTKQGARRH